MSVEKNQKCDCGYPDCPYCSGLDGIVFGPSKNVQESMDKARAEAEELGEEFDEDQFFQNFESEV